MDSIKKHIEGNAALLRFSGDQVTSGLRFTLLDDNGTVVSATTGAGTLSDEFHAFGGAVHGTPDYDTLHVLNDPDAFIVQSTNHSSTKTTNLYLRYEAYHNLHIELLTAHEAGEKNFANHSYGRTQYELTNHLGNVQTTVSNRYLFGDSKPVKLADIYTYADYYAYGMLKPGRYYNPDDYDFGFNGMRADDDVKGSGNHYTTFFRQYDPRLGRWFSVDPVVHPWMSSYAAFDLNPIRFSDPRGNTAQCDNCPTDKKFDFFREHEGNWSYNGDGTVSRIPDGDNEAGSFFFHNLFRFLWNGGFEIPGGGSGDYAKKVDKKHWDFVITIEKEELDLFFSRSPAPVPYRRNYNYNKNKKLTDQRNGTTNDPTTARGKDMKEIGDLPFYQSDKRGDDDSSPALKQPNNENVEEEKDMIILLIGWRPLRGSNHNVDTFRVESTRADSAEDIRMEEGRGAFKFLGTE